jgi:uncharacterized membrane protein (DUF4010 family)
VLVRWAPAAEATGPSVTNPFRLTEAIKFAAVYGLVLFVVAAAGRYLGAWGVVAAAVLAGLTDVDAITLTLAGGEGGGLPPAGVAGAIALAALSNTVAKAVYAAWLGAPAFRRGLLLVLGAAFVAGLGAVVASGAWPF